MKVLVFGERLGPPFDEGIKNVTVNLARELGKAGHSVQAVTVDGVGSREFPLVNLDGINRALFSRRLSRVIRAFTPDHVCYIPTASMTSAAFLRSRILRWHSRGAPVTMVALQPRRLTWWGKILLTLCPPDLVLAFSSSTAALLAQLGKRVAHVSVGVDALRFSPLGPERRQALRSDLGIPPDHKVVLHVGHLHAGRNLEPLKALQTLPKVQVFLVVSSPKHDTELSNELLGAGVRVLHGEIPPVELVYGLSDVYVFTCPPPAIPQQSPAIDLPLSVFEAMACGLPIVTTRFGGLPDLFSEAPGFRYVRNPFDYCEWKEKVSEALREAPGANRQKVLPRTWDKLMVAVLGAHNEQ